MNKNKNATHNQLVSIVAIASLAACLMLGAVGGYRLASNGNLSKSDRSAQNNEVTESPEADELSEPSETMEKSTLRADISTFSTRTVTLSPIR